MVVLIGLLSFVILLIATLLLRERQLRLGWQRIASMTLAQRNRDESTQAGDVGRSADHCDR
ncbi:hypothetical protein A6X21_21780 [Planctopirus hydrillae]|uniref:Uncharacterized protein n=1 Tax=Planctopirus hydrillae TaxID=1841610 RepID=A0A1C3EFW7_9PLAN|nr:hypothetical protein A6X21_21780 [Planctopirus hydrillae]